MGEGAETSEILPGSENKAVVEFMLTEYQALYDARGRTVERGQTYVNQYLTIITALVAFIAILSQVDNKVIPEKDTLFRTISPILLVLLLYGLVSYFRMVDRNITLTRLARGLNRIRRFFVDIEPSIQTFILLPIQDDRPKYVNHGLEKIGLHTIIALINSTILIALFNMAIPALFTRPIVTWLNVIISIGLFSVSILFHELFADKQYKSEEKKAIVHFPS